MNPIALAAFAVMKIGGVVSAIVGFGGLAWQVNR